jgi:hypothetical protein
MAASLTESLQKHLQVMPRTMLVMKGMVEVPRMHGNAPLLLTELKATCCVTAISQFHIAPCMERHSDHHHAAPCWSTQHAASCNHAKHHELQPGQVAAVLQTRLLCDKMKAT